MALAKDFDEVQSAYIGAETTMKDAQAFAETAIPKAHAEADAAVQSARGTADPILPIARGRVPGLSGPGQGVSSQPSRGPRTPVPGCRGKGHLAPLARCDGYPRPRGKLPRVAVSRSVAPVPVQARSEPAISGN